MKNDSKPTDHVAERTQIGGNEDLICGYCKFGSSKKRYNVLMRQDAARAPVVVVAEEGWALRKQHL